MKTVFWIIPYNFFVEEQLFLIDSCISVTRVHPMNIDTKEIDLSENQISDISKIDFEFFSNARSIKINKNIITSLNISEILKSNISFSLKDNMISTIYMPNQEELGKDEADVSMKCPKSLSLDLVNISLFLEGNPFFCDCKLYEFYNCLKNIDKISIKIPDKDNLTCDSPPFLFNKQILSLENTDFRCLLTDNCPPSCECYERGMDNKIVMNCSNQGNMTSWPSYSYPSTSVLCFEHNDLKDLFSFNITLWKNLQELHISHNRINTLDGFSIPRLLRYLDVSNNNLKALPFFLMEFVTNQKNFILLLRNNPWKCDCRALRFKKWLHSERSKIRDVNKVFCSAEMNRNEVNISIPIIALSKMSFCDYTVIIISSLASVAAFGFFLFISSILITKNKRALIAYTYMHFPRVFQFFSNAKLDDDNKLFDAFLSYCSTDLSIAKEIVAELEGNEPKYRICVHDRDWVAGELITTNIAYSVDNSCRTILLVSEEFRKSMWFMVEFRTAYFKMIEENINRMILIIHGELPSLDDLDTDLKYVISSKTYLVWGENFFWEKLRYALPFKKRDFEMVSSSGKIARLAKAAEGFAASFAARSFGNKNHSTDEETIYEYEACKNDIALSAESMEL